jgi:hypothetical protein
MPTVLAMRPSVRGSYSCRCMFLTTVGQDHNNPGDRICLSQGCVTLVGPSLQCQIKSLPHMHLPCQDPRPPLCNDHPRFFFNLQLQSSFKPSSSFFSSVILSATDLFLQALVPDRELRKAGAACTLPLARGFTTPNKQARHEFGRHGHCPGLRVHSDINVSFDSDVASRLCREIGLPAVTSDARIGSSHGTSSRFGSSTGPRRVVLVDRGTHGSSRQCLWWRHRQ